MGEVAASSNWFFPVGIERNVCKLQLALSCLHGANWQKTTTGSAFSVSRDIATNLKKKKRPKEKARDKKKREGNRIKGGGEIREGKTGGVRMNAASPPDKPLAGAPLRPAAQCARRMV